MPQGDLITPNAGEPWETGPSGNSDALREGSMASTALAGAGSAYSSIMSGRTNREIARFNALYARKQAEQARQAGGFAALRRQMVAKQLAGRTIANQAAGGSVVGAGTNRLVLAEQANASASDQHFLEMNADRQAFAHEISAAGDTIRGDMAAREGESKAIGSLLESGSKEWLQGDNLYRSRTGRGMAIGEEES